MGWGRLAAASLPLSSRRWPTGERLTACCIMKITTLRNPERAGSSSRALFLCRLGTGGASKHTRLKLVAKEIGVGRACAGEAGRPCTGDSQHARLKLAAKERDVGRACLALRQSTSLALGFAA